MGDKDTKDTYEADDSILNPSGKGEHTEVTETEDDGTENTYEADDSLTQAAKASSPRSQRLAMTATMALVTTVIAVVTVTVIATAMVTNSENRTRKHDVDDTRLENQGLAMEDLQ